MKPTHRRLMLALAAVGLCPTVASAKEYSHPWWLPSDYSTHGHEIDNLFNWIFWITTVTFVIVQVTLIVFLIKYRHNPNRKKAVFTHGNQRLEMCWTIAPAVILAVLALGSKHVWDKYRYSDYENDPNKQTVLVIGQQFKWNTIYAGPDGKLGAYMVYPKPTDKTWSNPDVLARARDNAEATYKAIPAVEELIRKRNAGQLTQEKFNDAYNKAMESVKTSPLPPYRFAGVAGPAFLPYDKARQAIASYIDQVNPLGKVFEDPDGFDDDWEKQPGREMVIAVNRPVEVQLGSKDVIHDFFLPNFRVKLDAVPGMRGKLHFQSTKLSSEIEAQTRKQYPVDDALISLVQTPLGSNLLVYIDEKSPGASKSGTRWRYLGADNKTIVNSGQGLTLDRVQKLKAVGITTVTAYMPGHFEIVCEELCGLGHGTMRGQMRVIPAAEFDSVPDYQLKDKPITRPLKVFPSTQPSTTRPAVAAVK